MIPLLHACVDTTDIQIIEPPPGAILPAGQKVSFLIEASAPLLASSGTVRYELITIEGELTLGLAGANINEITVAVTQPRIEDSGALPPIAVEALLQLFNQEIKDAIAAAAAKVIEQLFAGLLASMRPALGLDLPRPILQQTEPHSLTLDLSGLRLSYRTRVEAAEPLIARPDQGVL